MSITSFIKKVCVQTAVYWGNPTKDGYGNATFDEPIEIKCRWEDMQRTFVDPKGKEQTSKASILVTQDLDFEGWLCLGTLSDLSIYPSLANPKDIFGAYEIVAIDKIPMIKSNKVFVRTLFLGFKNLNN